MNRKSPLCYIRWAITGLSVAAVLGVSLNAPRPVEMPSSSVAPRLIVDGQETHGGGGGKGGRRAVIRVADGQETHGKDGKGFA